MANLEFYQRQVGVSTIDGLCDALCSSLMKTNRTPDFWVDWMKAHHRTQAYTRQLALLSTLRGSKAPRAALASLLSDYPEVAQAFPRLLAEQKDKLTILIDSAPPLQSIELDFVKRPFTTDDIERLVAFVEQSGLLGVLTQLSHPHDYLFGVEVGLDSNARKNRSGVVLERLVADVVHAIPRERADIQFMEQDTFLAAAVRFNVAYPPMMSNVKFDFAIDRAGLPTNVEVNFYGGPGSKPSEIVNAYSDRAHVLSQHGWRFVWVTDGQGWLEMRNSLRKGVTDIEYVLNYQMVTDGLLERIILEP